MFVFGSRFDWLVRESAITFPLSLMKRFVQINFQHSKRIRNSFIFITRGDRQVTGYSAWTYAGCLHFGARLRCRIIDIKMSHTASLIILLGVGRTRISMNFLPFKTFLFLSLVWPFFPRPTITVVYFSIVFDSWIAIKTSSLLKSHSLYSTSLPNFTLEPRLLRGWSSVDMS